MKKKIINIIVEGGVIQEINNIPKNIEVHVKDFDCDSEPGEDGDELFVGNDNIRKNEDGDCYWFSVWDSGD